MLGEYSLLQPVLTYRGNSHLDDNDVEIKGKQSREYLRDE